MKPNWLVLLYEQLREPREGMWKSVAGRETAGRLLLGHPACQQQKRTSQAQRHQTKSLRYKINYK